MSPLKLRTWICAVFILLILDLFWFYLMLDQYFSYLEGVGPVQNAGQVSRMIAAIFVYILIGGSIAVFVLDERDRGLSYKSLFLRGGFLGLALYGVYELTNFATLEKWPWELLLIDISWGFIICGLATVITHFCVYRLFK